MQQSKQQAEPEVDAKDGSTLVKQQNFGRFLIFFHEIVMV
jgi:hypothetical protein